MFVTVAAGHLGPAVLGLGAVALLTSGHAVGLLWLALILFAVLLVQIRNWFGLWSILVSGLGVFAVSWWASAPVQTAFACTGAWFLLLAAPRPVLELQQLRRHGRAGDSDADLLTRLTRVPGVIWIGAFLLATLAMLVVGGLWLLRAAA